MSSLASRCPACQTVFRVVHDQLRVSAGWVRCGRCAEVFNASEHMVDAQTGEMRAPDFAPGTDFLPTDAQHSTFIPPPTMDQPEGPAELPEIAHGEFVVDPYAPVHRAAPETPRAAAPRPHPASATPVQAAPPAFVRPRTQIRSPGARGRRAAFEAPPSPATTELRAPVETPAPRFEPAREPQPGALDASAEQFLPTPFESASSPALETEPMPAGGAQGADERQLDLALYVPGVSVPPVGAGVPASALPSFVVQAERAARWRQPRVRAALALGSLVALVTLAGQLLHAMRDTVAARSPFMQEMLALACETLECRVGAPRAIEALRVESSGLVRVDRSDLYRLSTVLSNRRNHEVALPALELALTDVQGQLIARRVLLPAELGARAAALGGGAELVLQATLQVAAAPVAGYTIELLYP